MIVLAVESSCDETAVAIVENGTKVLADQVASQISIHKEYGGVVPEIASRHHVEALNPLLDQALEEAGITLDDVDLVAATKGPGLVGALLVGLAGAKALAFGKNKAFTGVNHMEGHVCANYLSHPQLKPPFIALVVSGGHTYLLDVTDYTDFEVVGRTRDDAAGEAYDKVARALDLGYPGGPVVDRMAAEGKDLYGFPRVLLEKDSYDFSFSGLKTAVINFLHQKKQKGEPVEKENVCASFQQAVIDVLVQKTLRLAEERNRDTIVLSGGVAANAGLRNRLTELTEEKGLRFFAPERKYCTDNGAMIASAAYFNAIAGKIDPLGMADPNLGL